MIAPRPENRMEPVGSTRKDVYKQLESSKRKNQYLDRKVISVGTVLSVLQKDYEFDETELDAFWLKLQKEVQSKWK